MSLKLLTTEKHTYCFRYYNIHREICYVWIEAPDVNQANDEFKKQCPDCYRPIDVNETFNWR